jgi:hypothetical protein
MLPKSFPDTINCVDQSGQKQGWWLKYKIEYNPVDKPDELKIGDYVPSFSYGRYLNNRKIGTWKHISNVHNIVVNQIDSIHYKNDSVRIFTVYNDCGFKSHLLTQINADSTWINYAHYPFLAHEPIIFDCDLSQPKSKQCKMLYRGIEIKEIPFEFHGLEVDRLGFDQREIRLINEKLDKQSDDAE